MSKAPSRFHWLSLAAPIALLVVLAAMTVFLAIDHLVLTRTERGWVNHSRDVIETTQSLFSSAVEVESAQRAYDIGGDAHYLDHFDSDCALVAKTGAKLRALVKDSPEQSGRVARLVDNLLQRVAVSRMRVELYRSGHAEEARSGHQGAGKAAMDRARAAVAEIMVSENALLARRTAAASRDEWIGFIIAISVSGLAIVGLAALMGLMIAANRRLEHEVAEREAAQAAHRDSEARYQAIFANTADLLSVIDVLPDGVFRMAEVNPAYERATTLTTALVRG
ncbi:MAG TPA: CHASE3 domain-containing protein, partial [Caulobacteraceae bacterium]